MTWIILITGLFSFNWEIYFGINVEKKKNAVMSYFN